MNKFLKDLLNEIKTSAAVHLQSDIDNPPAPDPDSNIDKLQQFFAHIQEQADLDGETIEAEEQYWNELKNYIIQNPQQSIWNETINSLIKTYTNIYELIEESTTKEENKAWVVGKIISTLKESGGQIYKQSFNTDDIQNADAGKSFTESEPNDWVSPWYNTDAAPDDNSAQQSYSYVRGADKNYMALNNASHLQFTREQTEELVKQLRLIMPKNTRRVEIEDLNRNFWVIAQVLTGITAHLFGEESPFKKMFEGILNELIQLWENILYEWVGISLLLTPPTTNIHKDFFPLPHSAFQPYQKYDGFGGLEVLNINQILPIIQERVKPYKDKYTKSHLVLIPYLRFNNYQKNYFFRQVIPFICFYNRNTDTWSYCKILDTTGQPLTINPNTYGDRIYGARETDCYYKYTYPITYAARQTESGGPYRYYGSLRITPNFEAFFNGDKLAIKNLTFTATDGIKNIITKNNNEIVLKYVAPQLINEGTNSITVSIDSSTLKPAPSQSEYIILSEEKQKQAYYLGEMPSCYGLSSNRPLLVYQSDLKIIGGGNLFKIGNFLPQGYADYVDNPAYCAEQRNPNNELTDYIWNLTIPAYKGGDLQTIKNWYRNTAGVAVGSEYCYLYYPSNAGNNLKDETERKTAAQYNINDYKKLGQNVIKNFLQVASVANSIIYYVAAVGIKPWHNWTEGYYASNILTHVYRYIPVQWESFIEPMPDDISIIKNGIRKGRLQTLGAINRVETAFHKTNQYDVFLLDGTTWRLPQLTPEEYVDQLLIYKEQLSGTTYFVDKNRDPSLTNLSIAQLTDRLNSQMQYYLNTGVIMTQDQIKIQLSNPSGRWEVYDGKVSSDVGNTHYYKRNRSLREVAYTNFSFNNSEFTFNNPIRGRLLGDTSALSAKGNGQDYGGDIMLPPSAFNDMVFSW